MKVSFCSLFLCVNLVFSGMAQTTKVYYEKNEQEFVIYADNNELCPVSLTITLDLSNLAFSDNDKKVFVIPPKTERFRIGELTPVKKNEGTKFSYNYKFALGDITVKKYDTSFVYDLPFQKGKLFRVHQGYNGIFSHQNEKAIDFTMPEGTEILAAREGRVVQIVQNNTESCPREECKKYNNYIIIMHADGTYGYYAHIKYNGSKLKPGDYIQKGSVIGYSGNVGWSSGPHLHFACFLPAFDILKTLETRFRIDNGENVVLLMEGKEYKRDY